MDDLDFMWRGGYTKRYHTHPILLTDTVGHHSYNVACILMHLRPEASAALLKAALLHDVAEHKLGDMPAPAKRAMPGYCDYMNDGDMVPFRTVFGQQEEASMAAAGVKYPELTQEEAWALKFADCVDGMRFSIMERSLGNSGIAEIYENFASYAQELLFGECYEVSAVKGFTLEDLQPGATMVDVRLFNHMSRRWVEVHPQGGVAHA